MLRGGYHASWVNTHNYALQDKTPPPTVDLNAPRYALPMDTTGRSELFSSHCCGSLHANLGFGFPMSVPKSKTAGRANALMQSDELSMNYPFCSRERYGDAHQWGVWGKFVEGENTNSTAVMHSGDFDVVDAGYPSDYQLDYEGGLIVKGDDGIEAITVAGNTAADTESAHPALVDSTTNSFNTGKESEIVGGDKIDGSENDNNNSSTSKGDDNGHKDGNDGGDANDDDTSIGAENTIDTKKSVINIANGDNDDSNSSYKNVSIDKSSSSGVGVGVGVGANARNYRTHRRSNAPAQRFQPRGTTNKLDGKNGGVVAKSIAAAAAKSAALIGSMATDPPNEPTTTSTGIVGTNTNDSDDNDRYDDDKTKNRVARSRQSDLATITNVHDLGFDAAITDNNAIVDVAAANADADAGVGETTETKKSDPCCTSHGHSHDYSDDEVKTIMPLKVAAPWMTPLTCMVVRTLNHALFVAMTEFGNRCLVIVPVDRWEPQHISFSRKCFACACDYAWCGMAQITNALMTLRDQHCAKVKSVSWRNMPTPNKELKDNRTYLQTPKQPKVVHGQAIQAVLLAKSLPPMLEQLSAVVPVLSKEWFMALPQKLERLKITRQADPELGTSIIRVIDTTVRYVDLPPRLTHLHIVSLYHVDPMPRAFPDSLRYAALPWYIDASSLPKLPGTLEDFACATNTETSSLTWIPRGVKRLCLAIQNCGQVSSSNNDNSKTVNRGFSSKVRAFKKATVVMPNNNTNRGHRGASAAAAVSVSDNAFVNAKAADANNSYNNNDKTNSIVTATNSARSVETGSETAKGEIVINNNNDHARNDVAIDSLEEEIDQEMFMDAFGGDPVGSHDVDGGGADGSGSGSDGGESGWGENSDYQDAIAVDSDGIYAVDDGEIGLGGDAVDDSSASIEPTAVPRARGIFRRRSVPSLKGLPPGLHTLWLTGSIPRSIKLPESLACFKVFGSLRTLELACNALKFTPMLDDFAYLNFMWADDTMFYEGGATSNSSLVDSMETERFVFPVPAPYNADVRFYEQNLFLASNKNYSYQYASYNGSVIASDTSAYAPHNYNSYPGCAVYPMEQCLNLGSVKFPQSLRRLNITHNVHTGINTEITWTAPEKNARGRKNNGTGTAFNAAKSTLAFSSPSMNRFISASSLDGAFSYGPPVDGPGGAANATARPLTNTKFDNLEQLKLTISEMPDHITAPRLRECILNLVNDVSRDDRAEISQSISELNIPATERMAVCFPSRNISGFLGRITFPTNLTSLMLCHVRDADLSSLPSTLRELCIIDPPHRLDAIPDGVKTLAIANITSPIRLVLPRDLTALCLAFSPEASIAHDKLFNIIQTRDGKKHPLIKHLSIWGIPKGQYLRSISLELVITTLEHLFIFSGSVQDIGEINIVCDLRKLDPKRLATLELRGGMKTFLPEMIRRHSDRYAPYYGSYQQLGSHSYFHAGFDWGRFYWDLTPQGVPIGEGASTICGVFSDKVQSMFDS